MSAPCVRLICGAIVRALEAAVRRKQVLVNVCIGAQVAPPFRSKPIITNWRI